MGKPLRIRLINISALLILLIAAGGSISSSFGQIPVSVKEPMRIEFTQNNTSSDHGTFRLSVEDIESIFSPELLSNAGNEISDAGFDLSSSFFEADGVSKAVLGRMPLESRDGHVLFLGSLKNAGIENIGEIFIAFDFLYNRGQRPGDLNLGLHYKVNNRDWKSVTEGRIASGTLPHDDQQDGWGSISTQIQLSDLFLREGDELHLMWIQESSASGNIENNFGLQRFEVVAGEAESQPLESGDLIFTEIFSPTEVDGILLEYVELFNPTSSEVSLKGLEFETDLGSIVIQQDLTVPSYGVAILSNLDISSLPTVENSYFYEGSLLKAESGRVLLRRSDTQIATATYDGSQPGRGLELISAGHAFDGYSSLKDFIDSDASFFENLSGTPGYLGATRPLFTNRAEGNSTNLYMIPGRFDTRFSGRKSINFYHLDGSSTDPENITPFTPVFVENQDSGPAELGISEVFGGGQNRFSVFPVSSASVIISATYSASATERYGSDWDQILDGASPISLYWDDEGSQFRLRLHGENKPSVWNPVILNRSAALNALSTGNRNSSGINPLSRYVTFSVHDIEQDGKGYLDEAILGFINTHSANPDIRYDLAKIGVSLPERDASQSEFNHLFLRSPVSGNDADAFTHLPFRIEEETSIPVGFETNRQKSGILRLEWSRSDEIPDEWILTLEDTFTGQRFDMKEENFLDFRFTPVKQDVELREDLNQGPVLQPYTPRNAPRFRIIIEPFRSPQESLEEDELPNSIELRPNFPNPFNPSTNINFFLPEERTVRLGIFNIVGQQVATLIDDVVQPGEHTVVWDASDRPSGIYIVQLETGDRIFSRKITLIK